MTTPTSTNVDPETTFVRRKDSGEDRSFRMRSTDSAITKLPANGTSPEIMQITAMSGVVMLFMSKKFGKIPM